MESGAHSLTPPLSQIVWKDDSLLDHDSVDCPPTTRKRTSLCSSLCPTKQASSLLNPDKNWHEHSAMLENRNSLKILLWGSVSIVFACDYHKPSSFSNYRLYYNNKQMQVVQGVAAQDAIRRLIPLKVLAPLSPHAVFILTMAMHCCTPSVEFIVHSGK